jgi:hypothetical protein
MLRHWTFFIRRYAYLLGVRVCVVAIESMQYYLYVLSYFRYGAPYLFSNEKNEEFHKNACKVCDLQLVMH